MDYISIYQTEIPQVIEALCETAPMRRLRDVGMNCGCEYTSFPLFRTIGRYTRFEHSLGTALIVWRFTRDEAQSVSALLHDISTPVFAHVVDFMRGDHLSQTATESGTEELIASSAEIRDILSSRGIAVEQVCDYHIYPLADNPTPRLSADRLEYTCGNAINFSFASKGEIAELFSDIVPGENESGESELVFRSADAALRFARLALECFKVYVCDADRYSMQMLSELLRDASDAGVISADDLALTESEVIEKLCSDGRFNKRWLEFRAMSRTERAAEADGRPGWRRIPAKKRYIDPYILSRGRVGAVFPQHGAALEEFLAQDQSCFVRGS